MYGVTVRMKGSYKREKGYYDEAVLGAREVSALPSIIVKLHHRLERFKTSPYKIVFDLLTSKRRILDIGCRDDAFLRTYKDKFDEVFGIGISSFSPKES